MDELKIKAALLEAKNVIAADKLLEAQEQVETATEEASVAHHFFNDKGIIIVSGSTCNGK
jgi:hypothetical protein